MYKNKYLELLHSTLIDLRFRLREIDPQSSELLNIVHNLPSLLESERPINDDIIISELKTYKEKYNPKIDYLDIIEK